MRMLHSLGFISHNAVNAPTEVCEAEEKHRFYHKLHSFLGRCPLRDTLILGDFTATSGTDRAGCELLPGLQGSGIKNARSSHLDFFCNIQKLENCKFFESETITTQIDIVQHRWRCSMGDR